MSDWTQSEWDAILTGQLELAPENQVGQSLAENDVTLAEVF
jgi:hypothetical protein